MWKDSIRNIVVIFQPNILRIVGFYVRHSALAWHLRIWKTKRQAYEKGVVMSRVFTNTGAGAAWHWLNF